MHVNVISVYSKTMASIVIGTIIFTCQNAKAQMTVYAADQVGSPVGSNSVSVYINVLARVSPTCGSPILPSSSIDLGEIDRVLPQTQIALGIQCSGAFHIGLVSSNGGLTTEAAAPAGYTALRDYNLALYIQDDTLASTISLTCPASSLTASAANSSCSENLRGSTTGLPAGLKVNGPSSGKSSYLIISNVPSGASTLVAAKDYNDTITISVNAVT